MTKVLTANDLTYLPDMEQQLLFEYMNDLVGRHEALLGMAYIFVWISMITLLAGFSEKSPNDVPFSSVTDILITIASIVFTLSVFFLIYQRKPWEYSFHNKRVLSARQFFLQNFNMDISGLTPNDIWKGTIVERSNKTEGTGKYLTLIQRADVKTK